MTIRTLIPFLSQLSTLKLIFSQIDFHLRINLGSISIYHSVFICKLPLTKFGIQYFVHELVLPSTDVVLTCVLHV